MPEPVRPDPDALLARVQQEEARARRGNLKIFHGAPAGRRGAAQSRLAAAGRGRRRAGRALRHHPAPRPPPRTTWEPPPKKRPRHEHTRQPDEAHIRRFVRLTLEAENYQRGLPDGGGVDLIRELRQWSTLPVIVLSARSTEASKIAALDAGADDYLVKPFGSGELSARVRAQLRRHQQQTPGGAPQISFGDVRIDLVRRVVERAGEALHLTPIEYKLLTHLASQPDRVITHAQLLKAVWGPGHLEDSHYVRVHMANLRKKIEAQPSMPRHLVTETGIGYRFVA